MIKRLRAHVLQVGARFFGWEWYARKIGVSIGSGCRIYKVGFGSEPFLITIGSRVTVTAGVRLLTHDGSTWLVRGSDGRRHRYGRVVIGDDVFIGVNSLVLPGVHIGDRCVVGAGSVVTKSVPAGSVVAGVPAKIVGSYDEFTSRISSTCPSDADLPSRQSMSYREWVEACLRTQEAMVRNG